MALLPQQFARREGGATQLRTDPLRLTWLFDDLMTQDSHALRVRFSCSAQIADTEADKKMFREVFLGTAPVATVVEVTEHFAAPLRAAAAQAATRYPAEVWIGEKAHEMQSELASAAKPVAFACGLEILPPFHVELASPSLERARLESMQRARIAERVAGQVEHLQRATELLSQFDSLREKMPDLTPGQILQHMSPVDRGTTLQSLLMADAQQGTKSRLWAVAGPHLVRIDPEPNPPRVELISLPTSAGPLRSVQPATINGRSLLLVGARSGVMVVSPDSPAETQVYFDPAVQTALGFNRVVAAPDGQIWASHGEAGIVAWRHGQTAEPVARFHHSPDVEEAGGASGDDAIPSPPPAVVSMGASPSLVMTGAARSARRAGPRNVQVLDDEHVVYSVGNELTILGRGGEPHALPPESPAEIVAILPADERSMFVVHADSTIVVLSRETRQIVDRQKRAGKVCAAGALPWLGSVRLLLVDTDGPVDCVGFDDPLITQYVSNHRALRVVTASRELVAALSSDRQRLLLWQTWDGKAPVAEVHVTGIARHRVADVEFG